MSSFCSNCGTKLEPGDNFCGDCGQEVGAPTVGGGAAASSVNVVPWLVAVGVLAVVIIVIVEFIRPSPSQPQPGVTAAPTAQTPRGIADTYFDLAMRAEEAGDDSAAAANSRVALNAYAQIRLDADARFHIGLLHLAVDRADSALAQADSIESEFPGHLFSSMLRYRAASQIGDAAMMGEAAGEFMGNYESQIATGRGEYEAHGRLLEGFFESAGNP